MNPGFEEENICLEYEKNCAPEAWISTSLYADYYFDDAPNAFEGRHFTGLILASKERPQLRNYLRSRLLCGLRKDAQYKLQFYVRSRHKIFDSVGIYFSSADFLYEKDRIRNARPQLFINRSGTLKPTEEWQKVSLTYTANGDENFINIGDFNKKGHDFKYGRPDLNQSFYFFIDSISLTPVDPSEHLCRGAEAIKEEEYEFHARHDKLDRLIYHYSKTPPEITPLSKTTIRRIDTLVIPDVLFATNSYALNKTANGLLDSLLTQTKKFQIDSLVIEGHTDNQGAIVLNQKLSENRAMSVAKYFNSQLSSTIVSRGWASQKPAADNRTAVGRQKNRRVEIYIYVRE